MMNEDIGRLSRLGFSTLPECLLTVPKEFRDYHEPIEVLPLPNTGEFHYLALTLVERSIYTREGKMIGELKGAFRAVLRAADARGERVQINVIGKPAIERWLQPELGAVVNLYGQLNTFDGRLGLSNPTVVADEQIGRVVPIYQGRTNQVSAELLTESIGRALPQINEAACLLLEQALMHEDDFAKFTGIADPATLLRTLHAPLSVREGLEAIEVAKTLSVKALVNKVIANRSRPAVKGSLLRIDRDQVADLIQRAPFDPTADQLRAIDEIVADCRSPFPMDRVLSGDVGTGKSFTFMVPAAASHLAGARVAIIAPSQILVDQLASEFSALFFEIPIKKYTSKAKVDISTGIIVGTTAVLTAAKKEGIVFDLVVADEQHKFSVAQRKKLLAPHTNFLEATATAIPRTVALVKLGGMPISILTQAPVKREIVSRIITLKAREKLNDFVMEVINGGGQAAFIYPVVNGDADTSRHSVEAAYERFRRVLGDSVAMIHGGLPEDVKTNTIRLMKENKIKLLVASTVIEVGVTIPNLRLLVAVNAENFGVSQLHQLRGRLARKGGAGYFIMYLPEPIQQSASDRLRLLSTCSDGFRLAEMDADVRGFGNLDIDGDRQSGSARMLFWGITLGRSEIEQGAIDAGLIPAKE
ncbi:helicase-related protein [Pseudomonas helleri]|nr:MULTISPECIES: helicase-related protein [Pseudomonas]